ncbi:LEA type 2 family protein [Adhaeribacter soli]|uniref:LEA type 2 family protein n=1 Tax=Adhaeribacter soli TaxID=2607655 RepID=A0A5N1J4L4_9BACT|nr:LEA type 2 family protein [Adhaeribacter soli]KAA9345841.1 LEA type 2 family protein [Adhaeribacter soli]
MKRFLIFVAVLIGILILIGVVAYLVVPKEKLLAAVTPKIENLKITDAKIDEDNATMLANLNVHSRLVPIFIDSLQYEMRLFDQTVCKGHKRFDTSSKKGKVQTLSLPVTMNHNKTRELVRRQVKENEPVRVIMKAYTDIPLLGKHTFDIDKKVDMVVPALPGLKVKDMQIKDFGLDNMAMVMTMEIDNPNEFDFYIRQMNYDLVLKDFMISKGHIAKDYLIKARAVTPIQLTAKADTKKPLKNTVKMIEGKTEYPYTMTSHMVIEPRSDVVGSVDIHAVKTGSVDVVQQLKNVAETKKKKKKAKKEAKKAAKK